MTAMEKEKPSKPRQTRKTPPPRKSKKVEQESGPEKCGVCGEDKIKLPMKTPYKGLELWVCTNVPKKKNPRKMMCDGFLYKNAVMRSE